MLLFDAAGLAFFAVTGAHKALAFGLGHVIAALLGMLTCIGGGITRDVLVIETPQVLRSDLYAVAAVSGTGVVVVGNRSGMRYGVSAPIGGALCFILRFMAICYRWRLPTARLSARGRASSDPPSDEDGR